MMRCFSEEKIAVASGKANGDILPYLDEETGHGSTRQRRRRHLSRLKKIILMENEAKWTELMGNPPPYGDMLLHEHQHEKLKYHESSNEKSASSELNIVRLDGLVEIDDVQDEDEYKETVQDISNLSQQYGVVSRVHIPGRRDCNSTMSCSPPQELAVFVSFSTPLEAEKAKEGLDKKIVGGQTLSACLVDSESGDYNEHDVPNIATILVKGALFLDKIGSVVTSCNIRKICESFGPVVHIYDPPTLLKASSKSVKCIDIIVEYSCSQDAKAAKVGLQGRVVGDGRTLSSEWVHGVWVDGSVKEGVSLSEEDYAGVRDNLESSFTTFSSSAVCSMTTYLQYPKGTVLLCNLAKLWFLDASDSASAIKLLSGRMTCGDIMLIAGSISINGSSACEVVPGLCAKATKEELDALKAAAMSYAANKSIHERQATIQERYATGISVPQVSRILPHFSNASSVVLTPRCDDKELNSLIKSMLTKLMNFQERARRLDPSKARGTRRRIVFGLKETFRGLRLRRVKMVIIAHDIDACGASGGLDDKVAEIIKVCEECEIPIIYELNKRIIGRALKKNIKVSVVGIYHFDGVEEERKCILQQLVNSKDPRECTVSNQ